MLSTSLLLILSFSLVIRDVFYYKYTISKNENIRFRFVDYLNNVLEKKNMFRPFIVLPIFHKENIHINWMNYMTYLIYLVVVLFVSFK